MKNQSSSQPQPAAGREPDSRNRFSRRDLARRMIAGVATAAVLGADAAGPAASSAQSSPQEAPLTRAAREEATLKAEIVLEKYGARLSAGQKSEVRRLVLEFQPQLEKLRAYPLENDEGPALVFEPQRGERR